MLFRNFEHLVMNTHEDWRGWRQDVLTVLEAGIAAVEPAKLVRDALPRDADGDKVLVIDERKLDLRKFKRVRALASGKAAEGMMRGLESVLKPEEGLIVSPTGTKHDHFVTLRAGHPYPDENSAMAGEAALAMARATGNGDLLVLLLSGGASSLMEASSLPIDDIAAATRLLNEAGADVWELNTVRKHLSNLKGGKLALAAEGTVVTLVLSDVADEDVSFVGSGPTAPDATTFRDALHACRHLGCLDKIPESVRKHLDSGARGEVPETPKGTDDTWKRVMNVVVGGNHTAAEAAANKALTLDLHGYWVREPLTGEARIAGAKLAQMAADIAAGRFPLPRPACIVYGGETTVRVAGSGKGGRNQEAVLSAMLSADVEFVLASMGTDGSDGPTDAAGAIMDPASKERAHAAGLDPRAQLRDNDAYGFFSALDDLLDTGPTGTNVMDLAVMIVP